MQVLGIDPGIATTGYGFIKIKKNNLQAVKYGCITTSAKEPFLQRLKTLYQEVLKLTKKNNPKVVVIEKIFFAKNIQTAINVSHARGVIFLAIINSNSNLEIKEYTPLEVKQAIVGYGRARKFQIQQMVKKLLNLPNLPKDDVSDALAIAICYIHSLKMEKKINACFSKRHIRN